ncbi:condensation domain-containing protein [Actinoplanes sp. NPDC051475]|uniref:condensation domain-containing protein n=1 Tax=Actinoplanes sp. NPDC051475 TaxID=3157225 RepID=UPI003450AE87
MTVVIAPPVEGLTNIEGVLDCFALPFAFTGERSRSGPLTWGQEHMYEELGYVYPNSSMMNQCVGVEIRPDVTAEAVRKALRDVVERFESLRTVYPLSPDGPVQQVVGDGEYVMQVADVAPDRIIPASRAILERMMARAYELDTELPVRATLVRSGGQPRWLILVICHIAVDHAVLMQLPGEFSAVAVDRGLPTGTTTRRQPLDQAEIERSPAGRRTGERAIRHAESLLRAMPQTMLPRALRVYEEPRYRYLVFESYALVMAVPVLSARHRTGATAVLYAGLAAVSAYANGLDRAVLNLTAMNRFDEATRGAVGTYHQEVFAVVELGDVPMAEAIRRSGSAVLRSLRHGRFPVAERAALHRRIERERGMRLDTSCTVNHRPGHRIGAVVPAEVTAGLLAEAAAKTRWRWIDGDNSSGATFFLHVDETPVSLKMRFVVDTSLISPEEALVWLQSMERILVREVHTETTLGELGALTGLWSPERDHHWLTVDSSWVDLRAVSELVRRVAATEDADVFESGGSLVAYLPRRTTTVAPEDFRVDCLAALSGHRNAMVPHRVVLTDGLPASRDLLGWRQLEVAGG